MAKTFGHNLRELRRSKDVSQRELAEKVGVDFSYISKLENDRLPPPAADTIVKIAKSLASHRTSCWHLPAKCRPMSKRD